eukprot:SAG11_NODE_1070_length_5978_cov_2.893689_1_plen_115_part_00
MSYSNIQFAVNNLQDGGKGTNNSTQDLTDLAQNIWQLYATDGHNSCWGVDVLEDHDDDQGSGNHIRTVVRNELQSIMVERAQTKQLLNKLATEQAQTKQQLDAIISMLGSMHRA